MLFTAVERCGYRPKKSASALIEYGRESQLFAFVTNVQFELPTLKRHQHTAQFLPRDLLTIDNESRHTILAGIVVLDPSSHDSMIRDLQSKVTAQDMFNG